MVLEGLSEALHVSIEWLKGETDEYETDITDKKELQIRDVMGDILKQLPLDLNKTEDAFSKDLLLLLLKQYELFLSDKIVTIIISFVTVQSFCIARMVFRLLRNLLKPKLNCEKLTKDMKDTGEPPALRRLIQR